MELRFFYRDRRISSSPAVPQKSMNNNQVIECSSKTRRMYTIILTADFNRLVDVFEGQNKDAMDAVLLFVRWFNFIYYDNENRSTFDVD